MVAHPLSRLPGIDTLLDGAGDLVREHGHHPTVAALRQAVDAARTQILAGATDVPGPAALREAAAAALAARSGRPPRPVVNAAGVVVHTNLGRAPLSAEATRAMVEAAGYCNLEYDLESGARGSRGSHLRGLLAEACGAEDGIAVNNAAGALVLALAALCAGRDVPVSRGELIEIGGSFRLPEIMSASGARLVEVGTTNRTRAGDYAVTTSDVGMLLKMHPSNYRITGFTESPSVAELAAVARERGVPLLYDIGSGLLDDDPAPWLAGEPSAARALADGADLVIFSGDKLFGGPQAGVLAGRAKLVEACRRHPLARALRLDKLRIAALVATLGAHLRGHRSALPVWAMLEADPDALRERAERLADRLTAGGASEGRPDPPGITVVDGGTLVGGGSAPGAQVPSPVVRVACADPADAARRLRTGEPPIVVRVDDDALVVDLRTVDPADDAVLGDRLAAATSGADGGATEEGGGPGASP